MINQELFFRLYANCVIVDGPTRSVICDLQNNKVKFIPNLLSEILRAMEYNTIKDSKLLYKSQEDKGIDMFLERLIEEDLGFVLEDPSCFPPLDLRWEVPHAITNSIIDSDKNSKHDFQSITKQLIEQHCNAIQFRYNDKVNFNSISEDLKYTRNSPIRSIEVVCPYFSETDEANIIDFWSKNARVKSLFFYGSPFEKSDLIYGLSVRFIKESFIPSTQCGIIHEKNFVANIQHFTEALQHNTCLNRKVSIDCRGEIRNCPSLPISYGNIADTPIKEAIEKTNFKEYWSIDKSQIEVCKDCEFRYICSDCRSSVDQKKNANGLYPKHAKCNYNPYEGKWQI